MRKTLLLITTLSILLLGCGEAGVQLDVTKTSTVTFNISSATVNADADNRLLLVETVDFASEDFDEYIGDAESVIIDKLTYEVKDYTNTSSNVVLKDVSLGTDTSNDNVISISGLVVENTGLVLAYEDGNPESFLSAGQVANLESLGNKVLNRQSITFRALVDFTDDIDADYTIEFNFDITLRVTGE